MKYPNFDSFDAVPTDFSGFCYINVWLCHVKNGVRHREDGPALQRVDNPYCEWWLEGKLHRLDGPAIDSDDIFYFIRGTHYEEKEYWNHSEVVEYKIKKILTDF